MAVRPAPFGSTPLDGRPATLATRLRTLAAVGRRHRRLLAALSAGAAVLVTVSALTPSPPVPATGTGAGGPAGEVLPAGAGVGAPDEAERVAVAVRLADPAGLLLLRVGGHAEVLAGPDSAAIPGTGGPPAGQVLTQDAVVLSVPQPPGSASSTPGGTGLLGAATSPTSGGLDGVVLLAVPPEDARRLASAAGSRALSVAVSLPGGGATP